MTAKILDPDLSCNYSICGTDTQQCTVAFIASPSVLVHVQEKRVQKLLLACIDIEDRCRYERVSGNPMRAQVPQTQCCHRIRHWLYPPRGWCAAIGVTSQSHDQTDQSASTTLSCENVYSVKLFRVWLHWSGDGALRKQWRQVQLRCL